ncbi:MAG: putative aldouronate transport system substrate-binding protein [Micromonosporaceae bacterium]
MPREASLPAAGSLTRRGLLTAAAAVGGTAVAGPLLSACGKKKTSGPGTTSKNQLSQVLPSYVPNTAIKPDVPGVTGPAGVASDALFLTYPSSPVQTVSGTPGKGGTFTAVTPLWAAIPPSSGNAYYAAVNKAVGAIVRVQPADGNTYADKLPPLLAANKLPQWICIPGWNTTNLDFGTAVGVKFVDLTPYLAGDKVKDYPNLAAIPTGAWQAGVWNGKLYGIPVYPSNAAYVATYFYRKDIFDKHGIKVEDIKTTDDLGNVGKELTDAKAGVWAFDDLIGNSAAWCLQPFKIPQKWAADSSGKLYYKYEAPGMLDALNWQAKLVKAGYLHPDALNANNFNGKQRFQSGKVAVNADGTGAWDGNDAKAGLAANPGYNRQAFKLFSASGTPSVELTNPAGIFSYLNKNLSDAQIKEALALANYFAAPYGSVEWLIANFGQQGVDYTMTGGNPVLTPKGQKEVQTTFEFLATATTPVTVQEGMSQLAKDKAAWHADTVKYAAKPLFYAMNVTEPSQYASIGKQVDDTMNDVKAGRKPISAYQEAVATWRSQGGDALRTFYEGIRDKYGTGQ